MDILRIFRMQEPVTKDLLTKSDELAKYKEEVLEKNVLLKNQRVRIKELEKEIAEIKLKNAELETEASSENVEGNENMKVMTSYEDLFKKVWTERQELLNKNATLENFVDILEHSYEDLLEKFEKAKIAVLDFQENQDILKKEIDKHYKTIEILETKYNKLKEYSESKIAEANVEIDNKEKGNIKEVAKLKAKILQSQVKIKELEKHVKFEDICSRQSMFAPLTNNISKI